jgi:glycosyltransferase involved in cell wall biosynthesis
MTCDAVGGVWQYSLDLARVLRSAGVETTLAVLGPPPREEQRRAAERAGLSLVLTGLPLDWTADTAHEVEKAGSAVARLAAATAPDIVHLHAPALAAGGRFPAPVVAVAHSCVATWWRAVREGPLPPEFEWRTDLTGRGYRAAHAVLAPTAVFAEMTEQVYRLPARPHFVHNGRALPPVAPSGRREPFVFTAGRLWDDGKNLVTLDRAAARLRVPVRAAGSLTGPNGARIALPHLDTLGPLDDEGVARQLSEQPIFASAARYEPFGLAVLEAAQAGCALVLSDIPTFRELWDGAAAFVPAEDGDAFASAFDHLLRDPDARRRLAVMAKARAGTYSVEAMGEGVLAVYRSLLAGRTKNPVREAAA